MKKAKAVLLIFVLVMVTSLFSGVVLATETEDTVSTFESRTDFRDESIYSLYITRFYDGDSSNNVHCWDDATAGNPDSDPAWRGDFKGLQEKLDYIKALGFSAVMLNPVAQNASGYDYHGFHPVDLKKTDFRYESDGYTYEDLIKACHSKGLKVIQTVVLNSTSNFGEANLAPLFEVNTDISDAGDMQKMMVPTQKLLDIYGYESADEYWNSTVSVQLQYRLNAMKNTADFASNINTAGDTPAEQDYDISKLSSSKVYNPYNNYHTGYFSNPNWDIWVNKYLQIAGDKVDINTENYAVGLYLAETCKMYADYGADAIYISDARHITRLSLNLNIIEPLKEMLAESGKELEIFADVQTRYTQVWYRGHATESAPFYTWADDAKWKEQWSYNSDAESINNNMNLTFDFIKKTDDVTNQPTLDNALLNGITYHTPDYSKASGVKVFDFTMHRMFDSVSSAFGVAKAYDMYYNDATWNITAVDTWDYSPERQGETVRFNCDMGDWVKNLGFMFTFRGIPCITAGTEIEFQKGKPHDVGATSPLSETGRAYYGDNIEGSVTATDFGEYAASGTVANTLNSELSKQIRKFNMVRQAVPALRKGQYTTDSNYVSGNAAFIRRYTNAEEGIDSLALVATNHEGATFKNIPNGKYISAISGKEIMVTNGTLTVGQDAFEKFDNSSYTEIEILVCCADGFTGIDGAVGTNRYSLTLNADNNTGDTTTIYTTQNSVTLPECQFVSDAGIGFKAWKINGVEYSAGTEIPVTGDITANAVWEVLDEVKISYDANGGSGTMEGKTVTEYYYSLPDCSFTAPFGKTFKEWSVRGEAYNPGDTVGLNSANVVIKAVWQNINIRLTSSKITATALPIGSKIIMASYVDDKLLNVQYIDVTESSFTKAYTDFGLDCSNAEMIKAFLWNNLEDMVPLSQIFTYTFNDTEDNSGEIPTGSNYIYFKNDSNWSKVNAYFFVYSGEGPVTWPGTSMTNVSGTDIWYIERPENVDMVIFNNGSTQTADLTIPTDGSNLYSYGTGSWSIFASGGDTDEGTGEIPTGSNYIYFKNDSNWSKVNAYFFVYSGEGPVTWPGTPMTNASGTDIWYIERPENVDMVIFNNGNTNSITQTADLTIPTDGSNLYSYGTGNWSTYSSDGENADDNTGGNTSGNLGDGNYIYAQNDSGWSTVYAFYWSDSEQPIVWPGTQMTNISGTNIWYIAVPENMPNIIFNNSSGTQTSDLEVPTDGKNLFVLSSNSWSTYQN